MGQAFLYGNGSGGGSGGTLTVSAPAGVTVTVTKDDKTKTRIADSSGVAVFKGLKTGTWTVTIMDGEKIFSKVVTITTDYSTVISFNTVPEFNYTGDYEIVSDAGEFITTSQDNWKIRFLTPGTLTFTNLNGAEDGIDVFLVGGGGSGASGVWSSGYVQNGKSAGGGGGGYTATYSNIQVSTGVSYPIVVGVGGVAQGGSEGADGGSTSAFSKTVNGGKGGGGSNTGVAGGAGGSGGAGGNTDSAIGGSDGSDGTGGNSPGTGQGTTTREFGESTASIYAGGGSGSCTANRQDIVPSGGLGGGGLGGNVANETPAGDGAANTGGGGGGGFYISNTVTGGSGGSGIVIIRNTRILAFKIVVTYPEGSTCTVTDGTTTLTAPDATGSWACIVPNVGTWTVDATNGDHSDSKSVIVSASERSKNVTLDYYTYIYRPGASISELAGGGLSDSSGEVIPESYNKQIIYRKYNAYNNDYGFFYICTANKINFTGLVNLLATCCYTNKGGTTNGAYMYVASTKTGVTSDGSTNTKVAQINFSTDMSTVNLDVSAVTGEYYVGFGVSYKAYASTTLTIDEVKMI